MSLPIIILQVTSTGKNPHQSNVLNHVGFRTHVQIASCIVSYCSVGKCKVMSVHHRRYSDGGARPNYVINNIRLDVVEEIKDLGVIYDSLLLFDKHISEKINKD